MLGTKRIREFVQRITGRTGKAAAAQRAVRETRTRAGGIVEFEQRGRGKVEITARPRNNQDPTDLDEQAISRIVDEYVTGMFEEGTR